MNEKELKENYNLKYICNDNFKENSYWCFYSYFIVTNKENSKYKGLVKIKTFYNNHHKEEFVGDFKVILELKEQKLEYSNGCLMIKEKELNKASVYDVIKQEYIVLPEYDNIKLVKGIPFKSTKYFDRGMAIVEKSHKKGLLKLGNKKVNQLIPVKYDNIEVQIVPTHTDFKNYSPDIICYVTKNNLKGVYCYFNEIKTTINKNYSEEYHSTTRQVIPCLFQNIELNNPYCFDAKKWEFLIQVNEKVGLYSRYYDSWVVSPLYQEEKKKVLKKESI